MKTFKNLLLALIAVLAFSNTACTNKNDMAQSDSTIKAVFMGNSITQQWMELNPGFFSSNNFVSKGISGQTTPQFLARFRKDVIKLKPQVVVLNGGINDIAENTGAYVEDQTMDNIISMVELAKVNDIKIILTSVLPASGIPWNDSIEQVPAKVISLNKRIQQYAQENGITYVDYYSKMVNEKLGLKAEYTTDEVHLTPAGYEVMQPMITEAIQKELENK